MEIRLAIHRCLYRILSTISHAVAPLGAAVIWSMSRSVIILTVLLAMSFGLAAALSRRPTL